MPYAVLIYETEQDVAERPSLMPAYAAYAQALEQAGVHAGGECLHPTHTATTVRLQGGTPQVQDGPFPDTKEQLGGFFLIDVPDLTRPGLGARCPPPAAVPWRCARCCAWRTSEWRRAAWPSWPPAAPTEAGGLAHGPLRRTPPRRRTP